MIRLAALLLFAAIGAPLAAQGNDPIDERSFTCPVGGKPFKQDVGYAAFPLITLPDGSWLGDPMMDVQIPVCPDNDLVILPDYAAMEGQDAMAYGAYSAAEIAWLPALIADPAYRALAADNRHAQAWWLATQLGRPPSLRFHLLQRSTWATTDPALRQRRVAAFAAAAPALIDAMDEPAAAKQAHLFYVVNALRELGRFDAALALLDTIEADGPVPGIASPDDMFAPEAAGPRMRAVIAAGDDDRYPVELLDRRLANDKCSGAVEYPPYDQRTARTEAACARRAAAAAAEEAAIDEAIRLGDNPAERDRLCAATPADGRAAGLAQACETAQAERDRAAGDALAMQGRTTAARCQAAPEHEREGALFYACVTYDVLLESQLGTMLIDDDAAYAVLCGKDGEQDYPDRDIRVSLACYAASSDRVERAVTALLGDPAALDVRCARVGDDATDVPLAIACARRQRERQKAEVERLAGDDAAYKRECARFGGEPRDLFADDVSDLEFYCDQARYRRSHADELAAWDIADDDSAESDGKRGPADLAMEAAAAAADATAAAVVSPTDRQTPFDDGSELNLAARDEAAAIIAKAKADGTYPRRPKGQSH